MPQGADISYSAPLTTASVAYLQDKANFIAMKVFPRVSVDDEAGIYYIFDKGDMYRDTAEIVAPGVEFPDSDFDVSSGTFLCEEYAAKHKVPRRNRNRDKARATSDVTITEFVTQKCLIKYERQFASEFFTTSKWTGSTTGSDITPGTKWDAASSTPIEDVKLQARSIQAKTGFDPNILIVTPDVDGALKANADIRGSLGANERDVIPNSVMAILFEVDMYLVAKAVYNSAKKGATDVVGHIFGTADALLLYATPSPNLLVPSAGYSVVNQPHGGNEFGVRIEKYWDDKTKAWHFDGSILADPVQVCADCGVYFDGCMT